jgi:thioredoxin reductase
MNRMKPTVLDAKSVAGKHAPPAEHFEIVVIGAGPAGIAAAVEAAKAGRRVKLVDENPVAAGRMGLDVPLFYGQRMTAAVQNQARMLEQVLAASPALEEAYELGVDVALATTCWGAFVNGPGLGSLPAPVVGLADEERSWLCGFDRLIVAAGARDLVMFFEGADQPGVMGGNALNALLARYDAFDGRRIVVAGSGELALSTALLALDRGLEVAAIVEVRDAPQGPAALVEAVTARGVPILCSRVVKAAERGAYGVSGVVLVPPDAPEREERIACDTICLAVGLVPAVELLDVAGARLERDGKRGGFVPVLEGGVRTSLASVFAAGDCAGIAAGTDPAIAAAHGRAAAAAALRSLDAAAGLDAPAAAPPGAPAYPDGSAYPLDWMRALVAVGAPSVLACQCEEVTRQELLGVQPPRYLGCPSEVMKRRDLKSLAADGPIDQDQVKRLTRAGMGACQARRCREQVAMLLALGAGVPLEDIPLMGYRAPVRPLPLAVIAAEETAAMGEHWDVWFGIPTQWVPYDDIGTEREAEWLAGNMHL